MSDLEQLTPNANEYVAALKNLDSLTEKQFLMLQAHYSAPNQTVTSSQLGSLVGYTNYSSVNMQYGILAHKIGDFLNFHPASEQLAAIVEFEHRDGSWHWILRSEVSKALEVLGWVGNHFGIVTEPLNPGQIYKRTHLHDYFGGQRQGGICTPSDKDVILIFSGNTGESYGYQDGWTEEGQFLYTGEGQVGDMEFIRGNAAIRDHVANGKRILLFMSVFSAHVRYCGEFKYIDHERFHTPDRDGKNRLGIRFSLESTEGIEPTHSEVTSSAAPTRSYKKPNVTQRQGLVTSRVGQGYYRQEILDKFNNQCAVTGAKIPEILIASHIVPWRKSTDDEKLDVENGILLSPNYDALFDKHLISFEDDGRIILSPLLDMQILESLGIDLNATIEVTDGMQPYLERHRENLQ